jgi:hypothetical protein
LGGFQVEHATVAEREAFLYDPARLAQRFAVFESFTLPSLRAQTDTDFTFVIVTGDSLPAEALARLQTMTRDLSQVVVRQLPPGQHRAVTQDAINAAKTDTRHPSLQFRLDDDDAISRDFVAELRTKAADLQFMLRDHRMIALDFNRGYVATPSEAGISAQEIAMPYWTPALAVMTAAGVHKTIMNFSHHKIWQQMPTVTFTDTPMFVRGITHMNDSRQKKAILRYDMAPLTPAEQAAWAARFGIEESTVRKVFSTLEQASFAEKGE